MHFIEIINENKTRLKEIFLKLVPNYDENLYNFENFEI
jgi:hypothetical protein